MHDKKLNLKADFSSANKDAFDWSVITRPNNQKKLTRPETRRASITGFWKRVYFSFFCSVNISIVLRIVTFYTQITQKKRFIAFLTPLLVLFLIWNSIFTGDFLSKNFVKLHDTENNMKISHRKDTGPWFFLWKLKWSFRLKKNKIWKLRKGWPKFRVVRFYATAFRLPFLPVRSVLTDRPSFFMFYLEILVFSCSIVPVCWPACRKSCNW